MLKVTAILFALLVATTTGYLHAQDRDLRPRDITYTQEVVAGEIQLRWELPEQTTPRLVVFSYISHAADTGETGYYSSSFIESLSQRGLGYRNDAQELGQGPADFRAPMYDPVAASWWAYDFTAGTVVATTFPRTIGVGTWETLEHFKIAPQTLNAGATYTIQIHNCEVGSDNTRCYSSSATLSTLSGIGVNDASRTIDKFPAREYGMLIFAPLFAGALVFFLFGLQSATQDIAVWLGLAAWFLAALTCTLVLGLNFLILAAIIIIALVIPITVFVLRGFR